MANVGVRTRWLGQPRRPRWRDTTVGATTSGRHLTLQPLQVSKVGRVCANGCGFIARVPQRALTKMHLKQASFFSVSLPQRGIPKRRGATHSRMARSQMLLNRRLLQQECHRGCSIRWVWVHTPPGGGKRMKPQHASQQTRITINEITLVRGESAQAERFSGRAKWMWSIGAVPCHGPRAITAATRPQLRNLNKKLPKRFVVEILAP